MTIPVKVSNIEAAKLGITVLMFSSGTIFLIYFCKKTRNILKVKKLSIFSKKNRAYLSKALIILALLRAEVLETMIHFITSFLGYLFYLFQITGNQLIDNDFWFILGICFFKIVILPFWRFSLVIINFLVDFKAFDRLIFFEFSLMFYSVFWFFVGFTTVIYQKKNVLNELKGFVLDLLIFFFSTIVLILSSFVTTKEEAKDIREKYVKALRELFANIFLDFHNIFKNFFNFLQQFLSNQTALFFSLKTFQSKIAFLLTNCIDAMYFVCIWRLRIQWFFHLSQILKTLVLTKAWEKFFSNKGSMAV